MTWWEWVLAVAGTWLLCVAMILGCFAVATGEDPFDA